METPYEVVEAYYEKYDQTLVGIWEGAKKADGTKYPWPTINLSRAKRIWKEYMKFGFVRDERGVENLADEILDIIVKIDAMTVLGGHSPQSPHLVLKDLVEDFPDLDYDGLYDLLDPYVSDENGNWRISDYGLKPLQELASKLLQARTAEERVLLIDQVLNVVHQRSDLASWFVKGGRRALEELSNQEA